MSPAVLTTLAVLLAVALGFGLSSLRRHTEQAQGRRLFYGESPLRAHMTGDDTALPASAVRCGNCHDPRSNGTSSQAVTSAEIAGSNLTFGSPLAANVLTQPLSRRGGPESSYDTTRFCRLLRQGLDPALIVIPKAMPRYEVTDEECNALWEYVISR